MIREATGSRAPVRPLKPLGFALAIGLAISSMGAPALAANHVDPEAKVILQSMSTYLTGLTALVVEADVDKEVITHSGQKLQFSSSVTKTVQRPDKLHVDRHGPFAESQLTFDGKTLTLNVDDLAHYVQLEVPGNIEDALAAIHVESGLDFPADDLFYPDAHSSLINGATSGSYNGTAFVHGMESHHLVFRTDKVDWQIWIQVGDKPVPMKYVITSKWVTGAPQYAVRFRNWQLNPKIDPSMFVFKAPMGATRVDQIPVNELGELMLKESQ